MFWADDFERFCDEMRKLISEATANKISLVASGGSTLLVNKDGDRFYAALAIHIEYGASYEEAMSKLIASTKRMIDAGKEKDQSSLPEAGKKEPR